MSTRAEAKATVGDLPRAADVNSAPTPASGKGFCSVRHGVALTMHLCNFTISTQQMSLSIAIPAMVNSTALPGPPNASTHGPPAGSLDNWNETLTEPKVVASAYDWSPGIQGVVLSALNYGSFLASVPGGYVAAILGAKYLVGTAMLLFSVLSLFVPLAADAGVALLILIRVVQGVAQVMIQISQYLIWVKWAPPLERNQLITISVSGLMLGSLTVLLVGGFLCETLGWPYVFYIFGGIGCACSSLWLLLVYDDPGAHPLISSGERDYIQRSLAQQDCAPDRSVPIKAMARSLPLWSILLSQFSEHWYFYVMMAYLPTYLNSLPQVDLKDSGFLSALLLGVAFVCTILGGLLADFLLSREILTLIVVRRLFTATAVLFPSVFSVLLPWVSFSFGITMAFLVLSFATSSLSQAGALVNFIDIAPRYTGFLRGLSLVFAQLSGVLSPTVSGFFISQDSEFGWRNVFLLSAAVNISGLVFYLIFSQAEVQDWASEQTLTCM
ncbi:PREDICTED: probable small intestine urate exporter [Miniopterus natalensis]|uniref:probable small intestine urate exporter n=1 Tax=Miniopterus natalensis TaxID=291302 RepID=UPI0007A6EA30|nr:PREDICTED: probable small intestine urate exporter [Miniopterus natalensis]